MKQKYKVFINDKQILFEEDITPVPPDAHVISDKITASEIYREVINFAGNTDVFYIESKNPSEKFNRFLSAFPIIEAAGGIVRKLPGKSDILMIYRLGKWDLPKGKIDKGESTVEAALREVSEECGINHLQPGAIAGITYHIYEIKNTPVLKKTTWYMMDSDFNGEPVPEKNEGITIARWVPVNEINKLLPQCYKSIAHLLESAILNFS